MVAKIKANRVLIGTEAIGRPLVAVQITGIGSVGIRCPATRSRQAFTGTASGQSGCMERVDGGTGRRFETDGHPFTDADRCAVRRFQNKEGRCALAPDRTVVAEVGNTLLAQFAQYAVAETAGVVQIIGAD